MTITTIRVGTGDEFEVPSDQVVPWLCGYLKGYPPGHIDISGCQIDVDPMEYGDEGRRIKYVVEVEMVGLGRGTFRLSEGWALYWVMGLAAGNGTGIKIDEHASERARLMQALMIAHQSEWIVYHGLTSEGETNDQRDGR